MCWLVEIRNSAILLKQHTHVKGPGGGGQVVSMLVFYTNDPSLNPAEAYNFYYAKNCLKGKKKQKRDRQRPFLLRHSRPLFLYFRLFNTFDSMFYKKVCHLLDSNFGPPVLEATTLATEPKSVHKSHRSLSMCLHWTLSFQK